MFALRRISLRSPLTITIWHWSRARLQHEGRGGQPEGELMAALGGGGGGGGGAGGGKKKKAVPSLIAAVKVFVCGIVEDASVHCKAHATPESCA